MYLLYLILENNLMICLLNEYITEWLFEWGMGKITNLSLLWPFYKLHVTYRYFQGGYVPRNSEQSLVKLSSGNCWCNFDHPNNYDQELQRTSIQIFRITCIPHELADNYKNFYASSYNQVQLAVKLQTVCGANIYSVIFPHKIKCTL